MKRLLLIVVAAIPIVAPAQSRKQKKAEEKTNKEITANLTTHIKFLTDDKLEGRRTGTQGELLAAQYIAGQFAQNGLLQTHNTENYIQEFTIDEGKQIDQAKTTFAVNSKPLELKKDFYPLSFSANGAGGGSVSPGLNERDLPWFLDLKDMLEENKGNPHFDLVTKIKEEATRVTGKGAKALIVYNSDVKADDVLFDKKDASAPVKIPVVYLTNAGYKKFFPDETATYRTALNVQIGHSQRKARNVVGFINNNAPTTVILGAHFDHLGLGEDGNSLDGQGLIHNGADDNASGTAALIELARLIKTAPVAKNNYLFIAFSGEELGLFGSKYWLENPTQQITPNYMINMDMIGRYDPAKKLTVGGYGTSPVWSELFASHTSNNLAFAFDSSGTGPSDHTSFYLKNIPVLFFFTNSHADYHKATDDWDKINYEGELDIVKYILTLVTAADAKGKLAFTKTAEKQMNAVALPVTLGVMPDYAFSGKGMRIDGVSKGKLAERIGLQAGDVLLQLGSHPFNDVQSYMQVLSKFKKGDSTQLKIKRGVEEKIFDVTF